MDEEKSLTERFRSPPRPTPRRGVPDARLAEAFVVHGPTCHTPPTWTGVRTEADDAVQEAWIRLDRSDGDDIDNLGAWLTTVVAHVCLDLLRARQTRPQVSLDAVGPEAGQAPGRDVEQELLLADSLGPALLVVLDTLAPAERVAFVLHDMFAISFDEIAAVLGRSPVATRQLASRARRRVQGAPADPADPAADQRRQREIVDAFLAASRAGNFDALVAVLAPDVVVRADELAVRAAAANQTAGAPALARETRGAQAVAAAFKGRARGARRALIDGAPGAVWVLRGQVRAAFLFTIEDECIVDIALTMDPTRLAEMNVALLETEDPEE